MDVGDGTDSGDDDFRNLLGTRREKGEEECWTGSR